MCRRLYPESGGAVHGVRHVAEYRLGGQFPANVYNLVLFCVLVYFGIFMAVMAASLEKLDFRTSASLVYRAAVGESLFLYTAIVIGLVAAGYLYRYMVGSHCFSIEENAVVWWLVRPWKSTRLRLDRENVRSFVRIRILYISGAEHRGKELNHSVFQLAVRLRDDTLTELLVMDEDARGVAAWLGQVAARGLGVPFMDRR